MQELGVGREEVVLTGIAHDVVRQITHGERGLAAFFVYHLIYQGLFILGVLSVPLFLD